MSRYKAAALFVDARSIYKALPEIDCYDARRDARTFAGGLPIVAHPPCRSWGCLKAFAKASPGEHELGPWAVAQVRRWGGVVEHPSGSSLFRECGCPEPGEPPDRWGGYVIRVDQFHWGHRARKRTLLYIVGAPIGSLPRMPRRDGEPTHVIDRPGRARRAERPNSAGKRRWVTHRERAATPLAFADWLIEVARRAGVR